MHQFQFTALPPLSLYIHIPWCIRKCPYCDFNSHAVREALPESAYVDALLNDLEKQLPRIWGRTVESLFIGGGTPSLFSPESIDRLLCGIRARLTLKPGLEITLEANPGTVEQHKFAGFHGAGVNRLSIGVQSFDNQQLQNLGRIHNSDEAHKAIENALRAGFENLNIDLMFGLPGQTVAAALADLQTAINQQPTHISWYQLTIEPNTLFHNHPPVLPDHDAKTGIFYQGQSLLENHGYTQYEVSAWSQQGKSCQHNENYWRFGDYVGIGAGAHGKISDASQQTITRTRKPKHPKEYLRNSGSTESTTGITLLRPEDAVFEFALNRLRLISGFRADEFVSATGLPYCTIEAFIDTAIENGLLTMDKDHIKHTPQGWLFLDDLVAIFLPEN